MPQSTPTQADFLFDSDELHALAGDVLLRRALRHAQDKRVLRVALLEGQLDAEVEDEETEEQLALSLGYDVDGNLWYACDCASDPEKYPDSDGHDPWNPAVLDQRVARIHRLGQRSKVQVVHLVAEDAYESKVLELVQGKRDLFDNVVDADAEAEVVATSKKLAELLAEDLAGKDSSGEPQTPPLEDDAKEESPAISDPLRRETTAPAETADADNAAGEDVRRCIEILQRDFATRIERILGARGGLLVVLDHVDAADDSRAALISERVPVALIDARTLRGLERLGAASPAHGAEALYQAPSPLEPEAAPTPRLLQRARQKLEAANLLLRQACPGPAAELLLGAALNAAALRAGLEYPPEASRAAVWLYGEALPGGAIQVDDATLIMQAHGLAQAEGEIPLELLTSLAEGVGRFVAGSMAPGTERS